MIIRPALPLLLGIFFLLSSPALVWAAENDGWLPKLLPWGDPPAASQRSGPIASGAKRIVSATRDRFASWGDDAKEITNPIEGAGRFFRPDLAHQEKPSRRRLLRPASWFSSKPPAEKPLTVPDWMAQDRPGFENR